VHVRAVDISSLDGLSRFSGANPVAPRKQYDAPRLRC
jgi:hypothetical protein